MRRGGESVLRQMTRNISKILEVLLFRIEASIMNVLAFRNFRFLLYFVTFEH